MANEWPTHRNQFLGPYYRSTNSSIHYSLIDRTEFYDDLDDDTLITIDIDTRVSTDGGDSFSFGIRYRLVDEVYNGDATGQGNNPINTALDVYFTDDVFYYVYHQEDVGLGVLTYEFATDTWTDNVIDASQIPATNHVSGEPPAFIDIRSDGSYVVFYNGAVEMVMGTDYRRIEAAVWDGSAWTVYTHNDALSFQNGAQEHFDIRAAYLGSNDRVHLFYTGTSTASLRHRTWTSGDVLQSSQNVATLDDATASYPSGLVDFDGGSNEVAIIFKNSTGSSAGRATSADTPSWSTEQVSSVIPESVNSNIGAFAYDGDVVLHGFYVRDDDRDIEHVDDQGTGTWTSPEAFATGTIQGVSANYLSGSNDVGVLYSDGGLVTYSGYTLSDVITLTAHSVNLTHQALSVTGAAATVTVSAHNVQLSHQAISTTGSTVTVTFSPHTTQLNHQVLSVVGSAATITLSVHTVNLTHQLISAGPASLATHTVQLAHQPLNAAGEVTWTDGSALVIIEVASGPQTANLTWDVSPTANVADYSVFRRSPATGALFDPETDTATAEGITETSYDDVDLGTGEFEWQVFGRVL